MVLFWNPMPDALCVIGMIKLKKYPQFYAVKHKMCKVLPMKNMFIMKKWAIRCNLLLRKLLYHWRLLRYLNLRGN